MEVEDKREFNSETDAISHEVEFVDEKTGEEISFEFLEVRSKRDYLAACDMVICFNGIETKNIYAEKIVRVNTSEAKEGEIKLDKNNVDNFLTLCIQLLYPEKLKRKINLEEFLEEDQESDIFDYFGTMMFGEEYKRLAQILN